MAKEETEDALDPQETLEALEDMVKEKFKDLLVSMSISSQGALFLHIWQQPSDWYGGQPEYVLEYLPLFHIIGTVTESTHLQLKLITYHGKLIEEQKSNKPTDEEKFNFVKKLQLSKLCQGVSIPESDFRLDVQTFSNLYLVEQFEEKVVLRSRNCQFAIFNKEGSMCKSCAELLYGHHIENGKGSEVTKDIKVEADPWDYTSTDNIGNFSNDFIVDSEDDMFDQSRSKVKENVDEDPTYFSMNPLVKTKASSRLKCVFCNKLQSSQSAMRSHLISVHWKLKPFKCKHCEYTAARRHYIYTHHTCDNSSSSPEDVVEIPEVMAQVVEQEIKHDLLKLNDDHDEKTEQKYNFRSRSFMKCFICGEHMKGKALRRHLWSKHLQLKPFKCKHCDFTSISQFRIYNQHYKKEHGNGDIGSFDDVEPILAAVKAIEEFEQKNKLNLGPPLLENLSKSIRKRKSFKFEDDCHNIQNFKVEEDDVMDNNGIDDFNNLMVGSNSIGKKKKGDKGEKSNIECLICLGIFSTQESFEDDQRKHAEFLDINGKEQCPTCNVSFDKLEMNLHFKNDHAELNAGCCLYCRSVMGRKMLRSHIRKKHWTKNQLCNICGKSFNAASMKDHQEVFHGDKSKNVICIHCGKKFSHQFRLTSHVSKMHSAKKDLPCKFCGQMFHDKTHVRAHTWAMHIKVKPYKCKHCHA